MKIYKLSQGGFQMVPPNATGEANPYTQIQNLQTTQQSLQFIQEAMNAASQILADISKLDDVLGVDTGLRSTIGQKINQAIMQTDAFQMVQKMGYVANVDQLSDPNKVTQLQQMIQTNIQDFTQGLGQMQAKMP